MGQPVAPSAVHVVEHGEGLPVLVLHGAGVDHREAEACFDPPLAALGGFRRLYPDLPGMGRTPAPAGLQSADGVVELLLGFADQVIGRQPFLLLGHSAGAYFAQAVARRRSSQVAGLALICPLLAAVRDVPAHEPVVAAPELGDDDFRSYFVVQTPEMLDRYERFVAPAARLVDAEAAEQIGSRWQLTDADGARYEGPTLVIAGRQDSTVGYAASVVEFADRPGVTLVVLDGAGHALPHEQPAVLAAVLRHWVTQALGRTT